MGLAAVILSACVLLGIVAPRSGAADLESSARLERALDDYARALAEIDRDVRLALFARAEEGFAALIAEGAVSAAMHTNLGNAALQAEHPGRAVLAYHRALLLDPDSAAASQNLAHVRSLLPAWVPRPDGSAGTRSLLFYRPIPKATRTTAAAICFALTAACFALSVRRSDGAWRGLAIFAAAAWVLLLGSVVFDGGADGGRRGVVTADEVLARSADSPLAPLALPEPLPAGVEVELLEQRADWVRVRLANGRDVWLRRSSVTRVSG
ncbi:MAG: hypothetical protein CL908_08060 [Deltaproteobacteria bacterium]|nr:hypothetical protein [Deltaproteobacteria bacterium]